MVELQERGELASVVACHVDHGLRAGSERDAEACEQLCRRLGVELRRVRVQVGLGNLQAAARRARYGALRREASATGATRIATGHNRDDQAETVLLHLLRGAGARGLGGLAPRRGPVVRPLLDVSRVQILAYLEARGLSWLEDPTNRSPRFLRNRVRAEAMPVLRALAPGVDRALARAADLLREDEKALASIGKRMTKDGSARVDRLLRAPVATRRRAVRELWRLATGSRRGLSAAHVQGVVERIGQGAPARLGLPGGFEARVRYGVLTVEPVTGCGVPADPVEIPAPGLHRLPSGAVLEIGEGRGVRWPLWWRTRRPGDRLRPEGKKGSKKLKAWLIDRKVKREGRDSLLLLADDAGWVLWIPELGVRSSSPAAPARLLEG